MALFAERLEVRHPALVHVLLGEAGVEAVKPHDDDLLGLGLAPAATCQESHDGLERPEEHDPDREQEGPGQDQNGPCGCKTRPWADVSHRRLRTNCEEQPDEPERAQGALGPF